MNSTLKFRYARLTALCATLGFASLASAQTSVTTIPVGAMTYSFPATTSSVTTYISIPLTNPSVFTGPVASLTANTITFAGTPFTATSLAAVGSPFFARIATGAQAGRTILVKANTTNSITLDTTDNSSQTTDLTTSGWSVAAGDRIEIIVGDTLASLLGDNTSANPLLFVASSSPISADSVGFYNKTTGLTDSYFFSTTSGFWRPILTNSNSNNLVVYPEASIAITRRNGRSATALVITGDVPAIQPLTKTIGGTTIIFSGSRYPANMKLSSVAMSSWNKSNSAISADTINIYNSVTGKFESYFQRLDNNKWNLVGGGTTDKSDIEISAGQGFSITKRGAVIGQASMLSTAIPYTL